MNTLKKIAFVAAVALSVITISTSAEAYRCAWHNGHRVCWHEHGNVYRIYPHGGYYSYTSRCYVNRYGYRICR